MTERPLFIFASMHVVVLQQIYLLARIVSPLESRITQELRFEKVINLQESVVDGMSHPVEIDHCFFAERILRVEMHPNVAYFLLLCSYGPFS